MYFYLFLAVKFFCFLFCSKINLSQMYLKATWPFTAWNVTTTYQLYWQISFSLLLGFIWPHKSKTRWKKRQVMPNYMADTVWYSILKCWKYSVWNEWLFSMSQCILTQYPALMANASNKGSNIILIWCSFPSQQPGHVGLCCRTLITYPQTQSR